MFNCSEILSYLYDKHYEFSFEGNEICLFDSYCQLSNVKNNAVTWIKAESYLTQDEMEKLHDNIIVTVPLSDDITKLLCAKGCFLIECEYPKAIFFDIVEHFFVNRHLERKIESTSVIETTKIGERISIGHFCHIGKDVVIGDDVVIADHVVIIGTAVIGNRTIIHSGVIIGTDGFGLYTDVNGNQHQVPHTGGVIIGDDVLIGANCCIDKGTIDNTIIGNRVKIDNLCHIAHNVNIGEGCTVIALSLLAGSVVLEPNVYIAPCAAVMNQVHIGEDALVGMGAVVTKDVEANKVVAGVPAKVLRDNK